MVYLHENSGNIAEGMPSLYIWK